MEDRNDNWQFQPVSLIEVIGTTATTVAAMGCESGGCDSGSCVGSCHDSCHSGCHCHDCDSST